MLCRMKPELRAEQRIFLTFNQRACKGCPRPRRSAIDAPMNRTRKLAAWIGWATLVVIAFSTLSSIGLRPHFGHPTIERFFAYALLGFLFGFAYPRYILLVIGLIVSAAVILELGQTLEPDRHGRIADAGVKVFGGLAGIFAATVVGKVGRRFAR